MKVTRLLLVLMMLTFVGTLSCTGSYSPHYIFYLADNNCATLLNGDEILEFWAFPEDVIVWINPTSTDKRVTMTVNTGTPLAAEMTFVVRPGKRHKTKILESATGLTEVTINTGCAGGSGTPKVNVGDPP